MLFSVLFTLCFTCISESAKILGIFPSSGYSQYILGSALMRILAEEGHEVTVISFFSLKTPIPNYRDITVNMQGEIDDSDSMYNLESLSIFSNMMLLYSDLGLTLTELILKDEKVQELLHSDYKFDLVICEQFANEAHAGFAYYYKTPLILFSSLGACEWTNHLVANPSFFSHVPMVFTEYSSNMNFLQRLKNTVVGIFDMVYRHLVVFPKQNDILQKYFPEAPHISKLMYNSSLVLLNSHVAINAPVAHVPSMIEIGGFHVSPKKLPKDLQDFLDNAKDSAIFFSMGSNLKSSDLSESKLNGILRVFKKLKQKVLWKWEDEYLPGKPDNVKTGKWLPQQDVLAHPNVRAFISHGGLLSTTEAVYNGVPIVGIPIFGDQKMNIETAVAAGYAIKIPFQDLTEENLEWALNEILTNTSYRMTAQLKSKILKDQPMSPKDTAVFWINYVLRHQGTPHLRTSALDLYWYQYLLLDVIAFVVVGFLVVFMLLKLIFRQIFKRNNNTNSRKVKRH